MAASNFRLNLVTLGVADIARSRAFYVDGLGFRASSASTDDVVFLFAGGVVLGLYPKHLLAEDANIPAEGSGFGGIALAHNVATRADVDATLARAEKAGAKILKSARDVFWGGYSGYFSDPDGYLWEIAFNPYWELDGDGLVKLPH
ncbi:VOC family protein [bacterium]|nr:VOC family protein [bacterium]